MLGCSVACTVAPPTSLQDKITAFQKYASMYIKYILSFRKLEECYDQMVHPQKRRDVRHILDGTMGRCDNTSTALHDTIPF